MFSQQNRACKNITYLSELGVDCSPEAAPSGQSGPAARSGSQRSGARSLFWFRAPVLGRWLRCASRVATSDPATTKKKTERLDELSVFLSSYEQRYFKMFVFHWGEATVQRSLIHNK